MKKNVVISLIVIVVIVIIVGVVLFIYLKDGTSDTTGSENTSSVSNGGNGFPNSMTCEDYHFGTCPEGCIKTCVASCPECRDCAGPGSCTSPDP